LAHRGNKACSEGFDLVHRREASKPNAIWQVDHAQLDIWLLREDGSVAKPWLTIVIDDYSRAVAGYYLGFDPPSSLRTTLALHQGVVLLIIWHILVQIIWHTVASGAPRRFAGHPGASDSGRTVPAPHILTLDLQTMRQIISTEVCHIMCKATPSHSSSNRKHKQRPQFFQKASSSPLKITWEISSSMS